MKVQSLWGDYQQEFNEHFKAPSMSAPEDAEVVYLNFIFFLSSEF